MHIEDDFVTVVPPPFEAGIFLLSLSGTKTIASPIPYPFNGGTPGFPTIVQDASRKSIPQTLSYRDHTIPDSLKRNK
jgi:hypothetical protein